MTTRAVLSAGSNIGDRNGYLRSVIEAVGDDLVAVSSVYLTAPWGGVEQADFANVTLIAEGRRSARQWLDFCRECEGAAQRLRDVRWGPRTLDVDVISVEADGHAVRCDDPELVLPHPRAAERAFVLAPWLEIDPDALLWTPRGERAVADLLAEIGDAERAGVRREGKLS